ncbi:MAG: hypothetical protein WB780_24005 [Candidatus Acidiferrales bacterium]
MRYYPRIFLWMICGFFLLLVCASSARAQCGVNTVGYGDVGIVTGNPFSAEIELTRTGSTEPTGGIIIASVSTFGELHPRSVARDSQGRIRTDRVIGKFKHDTGAETGTTVEDHMISICDPVAQTLTEIDTLNATAKIIHSRPSMPNSPRLSTIRPQRTFCSSRMPFQRAGSPPAEDLGDQTIEGVQAHGLRIAMPMLSSTVGGEPTPTENFTDRWCSDELSAVMMTVNENTKAQTKTTIAVKKLERNEPDPALFQIPAGYAITESVPETRKQINTKAAPSNQP